MKPIKRTLSEKRRLKKALILYERYGYSARKCARETDLPKDWVLAEIKKAGIFISKDLSFNEDYFEKIDTEDKAYWLGFILADGSVHKDKKCLDISIKGSDIDHLNKLKRAIEFKGEVKTRNIHLKGKTYKACRLTVYSGKLLEDLSKYGVVDNKTFNITYPDIPLKYDKAFMRGYVDGDGSLYSYMRKDCITPTFCFSVLGTVEFLATFQSKVMEALDLREVKIYEHGSIYEYKKAFGQALTIAKWLYEGSSIYLDRKYRVLNEYCRLYQK